MSQILVDRSVEIGPELVPVNSYARYSERRDLLASNEGAPPRSISTRAAANLVPHSVRSPER
jgi:hypothetical protein